MKDGIYAVEVNDGGRMIVVQGEVKHGIFRGLGSIAHLTGLFMADESSMPGVDPMPSSHDTAADPAVDARLPRVGSALDFEQAFQQARHRSLIAESTVVRRQFHDQLEMGSIDLLLARVG